MAGITNPTKLGGIFGLSCYLLLQKKLQELVPEDSPNKETPIVSISLTLLPNFLS